MSAPVSQPPSLVMVLDAQDAARVAEFWAAALHYSRRDSVEQYEVLVPPERGSAPPLLIQQVAEPRAGKNRMHLDLHVPDVPAEVARLEGLGATRQGEGSVLDIRWVRMADPEGNEFDVATD